MTRLWDRGEPLDAHIEALTVGRDPELDLELVPFDALGSAAHAQMLGEVGILAEQEVSAVRAELREIARAARDGRFRVSREDEDGHTAIENRLTRELGDAGKRIHTGRSRNDQIIGALRLWGREAVLELHAGVTRTASRLLDLADDHRETSIPGYSHTRQAMPTTLGHLFAAHAEGLLDDLPWLERAFSHLNRSPLGSASGFGVALPLDREMVTSLLGFEATQVNTLAVQNDRGKTEYLVLGAVAAVALDCSRLAADVIWYSSDELGFVSLAADSTTGSSIMPQKRNPDVLELIRAGARVVASRQSEIAAVYGGLASGYHRDLQLTKEPFLAAIGSVRHMLAALAPVLDGLRVDRERCRAAVTRASGATDAVYRRVADGEPFRTAYKDVAADPEATVAADPAESWRQRTHLGAPGALDLESYRQRAASGATWLTDRSAAFERIWNWFEGRPG